MRSVILSFTAMVALGIAPAFAQTGQQMPNQQVPMEGQVTPGELPAPPQHVPLVRHPTNLTPRDTRSVISPALPQPMVGPNADATEYLRAAQRAINRHQLGEAQAALENAETYLLNRSVPMGTANEPDQNPAVHNIQHALDALGNHRVGETMSLIQQTIPMAQQSEMAMQQGGPAQPGMGTEPGGMNGTAAPPPPPPTR